MNDEKKFTPDESVKELSENELENVTGGVDYVDVDGTVVSFKQGDRFLTWMHPWRTCIVVLELGEGLVYRLLGETATHSESIDTLMPHKVK